MPSFVFYIFLTLVHACANQKLNSKDSAQSTKKDVVWSCSNKNLEYPISADDLNRLISNGLSVDIQSCPSNSTLKCLSVDCKSLIGAGSFGLVVRGRSNTVRFPVAIKFIKLPTKLDMVSFNTVGRYNRIDLSSLIESRGNQKSLREAVALRLITEYEIPSIPKYVSYIEASAYRILVMELLDGYEELSKIIDTLSAKDLIFISCQTAAIVCNLDQIGLSHDDMHERNILIDRKNSKKVNLIDFGGAHFVGKQKHFTSTSNFLKQPINLWGHLRRIIKENIMDHVQSQEKTDMGSFCSMMEKIIILRTDREKEVIPYHYRVLFEKYWKFSQTNKKLFKCSLTK